MRIIRVDYINDRQFEFLSKFMIALVMPEAIAMVRKPLLMPSRAEVKAKSSEVGSARTALANVFVDWTTLLCAAMPASDDISAEVFS